MALFSTNTARILPAAALLSLAARLTAALRPTPKSPNDLHKAEARRIAARARVDHLLR